MRSVLRQLLGLLWISSMQLCGLALLIPLLVSRKVRELCFVAFFWLGTLIYTEGLATIRRIALEPLHSLVSHDPALRERGTLKVLEIGAGFGSNFEHMRRSIEYTNVDPNQEFGATFLKELEKYPKVAFDRWVQAYGEDMSELASGRFDVVICTYVLCSAKCGEKLLREARRILAKGGHFIFLEHVAYPRGTWQRILQNLLTPLWKLTCCNCHLNRDSADLVKEAGFTHVTAHYTDVDMATVLKRQVYGIATV